MYFIRAVSLSFFLHFALKFVKQVTSLCICLLLSISIMVGGVTDSQCHIYIKLSEITQCSCPINVSHIDPFICCLTEFFDHSGMFLLRRNAELTTARNYRSRTPACVIDFIAWILSSLKELKTRCFSFPQSRITQFSSFLSCFWIPHFLSCAGIPCYSCVVYPQRDSHCKEHIIRFLKVHNGLGCPLGFERKLVWYYIVACYPKVISPPWKVSYSCICPLSLWIFAFFFFVDFSLTF